jgi:itaconate CoA-transferase
MTTPSAAEHYRAKLCTAGEAVSAISSCADIAIGMAVAEPPALLTALAARVEAGDLADLRPWYFHSLIHAGTTLLRYELLDRVHPRCMFLSPIERALIKRGEAEGRVPIEFVPVAFSESSRLLSDRVDLEAFVTTVSPMDRNGLRDEQRLFDDRRARREAADLRGQSEHAAGVRRVAAPHFRSRCDRRE